MAIIGIFIYISAAIYINFGCFNNIILDKVEALTEKLNASFSYTLDQNTCI